MTDSRALFRLARFAGSKEIYDDVYRLTSATYPTGPAPSFPTGETFGYDAGGNRTAPGSWAYDSNNRIEASPATPVWCHDADGNLASKRSSGDCATGAVTESFTFDATNRLRGWTDGAAGASYTYDPFGRRIEKTVGGTTTWYLWDGDQLLAEYDDTGAREVRYAYAGGFAPAQVAYDNAGSEVVYHVHTDHLDTPRMLTDASGTAVWRATYAAFGNAHLDPGSSLSEPFNIRFPGQYYDAETQLHDNRHRYYSPGIGRYVSSDPIGQFGLLLPVRVAQSLIRFVPIGVRPGFSRLLDAQLYTYALNSPLVFGDVNGLIPFTNNSSAPISVSGNPGPGDGSGPQVTFSVAPGQTVDANNPFPTNSGPVSDVDFIDQNGDGIVDQTPGLKGVLFGEKVPGTDTGIVGGVGQCIATDPLVSGGDPFAPRGPADFLIVP